MALILKKAGGISIDPLDVGDGRMNLVDVIARFAYVISPHWR